MSEEVSAPPPAKRRRSWGEEQPEASATSERRPGALISAEEEMKLHEFLSSVNKASRGGDKETGCLPFAPPPMPAGPVKAPPPIYFDVLRPDGKGGSELLGRMDLSGTSQLTFGRDASKVDIPLEHGSVSRHHASMTFDGTTAFLSDFRSTHGTFVATKSSGGRERRLEPKDLIELAPGDVVRFGESSRRYVFGVAPPPKPEPKRAPRPDANGVTTLGQGQIKITVRIPDASSRRLLGRNSLIANSIQQRTGALITVGNQPILDPQNQDLGYYRVVHIRGTNTAVAIAKGDILAICTGDAGPPMFSADGAASASDDTSTRFRYSSTVVNDDDDDDAAAGRRGRRY